MTLKETNLLIKKLTDIKQKNKKLIAKIDKELKTINPKSKKGVDLLAIKYETLNEILHIKKDLREIKKRKKLIELQEYKEKQAREKHKSEFYTHKQAIKKDLKMLKELID